MNRKTRFLAAVFFAFFLAACSRGHEDVIIGPYTPAISSPIKIKIADVSNDTRQVFDVDVIGLLWSGLEDSLKKRGMLWTPETSGQVYTMEAHVLQYKKGYMPARVFPYLGDTVLSVRCVLLADGKEIGTIESKHKITVGSGTLTRGAWRKIFSDVAEEVVIQATRKL